jgi:tripartite-type tricarboxylate transporter receptor subunit TctC
MMMKWLLMMILSIVLFWIPPTLVLTAPIEKFPTKAIEVIVPFAPGGPTDIGARAINEKLSKRLEVPVMVINKPGAGGLQGTSSVARAKKDGYTLLSTSAPPIISMPVIEPQNVDYNAIRDFEPLGRYGYITVVILVRSDSQFRTLEELVDFVKKNPGKLNCGIPGIGLVPHLVYEILKASGLNMAMIVAKGVPQNISFLMGGHIDVSFESLSASAGHIRDGKFRALAIVLEKRFPDFPNIPTLAEKGYPHATLVFWAGFFAPAGIPQEVRTILVPALKQAIEDPEIVDKLKRLQFFPDYGSPEDLRKEIANQQRTIRDVAIKAGMIKE